jgi:hypothetical protein
MAQTTPLRAGSTVGGADAGGYGPGSCIGCMRRLIVNTKRKLATTDNHELRVHDGLESLITLSAILKLQGRPAARNCREIADTMCRTES